MNEKEVIMCIRFSFVYENFTSDGGFYICSVYKMGKI